MEEQDDHRQDGAQLDHHVEHGLEGVGGLQLQKFIQQDDMARGGDRKPFRDALHNAKEDGF